MATAAVYIQASSVAALIGKHRYRSREQALLETLDRQRGRSFSGIKAEMRNDEEIRRQLDKLGETQAAYHVLPPASKVTTILPTTTTTTTPHEVRSDLLAAKTRLETELEEAVERASVLSRAAIDPLFAEAAQHRLELQVKEALGAAEAALLSVRVMGGGGCRSFKFISRRIKAHFLAKRAKEDAAIKMKQAEEIRIVATGTTEQSLRLQDSASGSAERLERTMAATTSLAGADDSEIARAAGRACLQRRGEIQEAGVLDAVAVRERAAVTNRNTRNMNYIGDNYIIVGRVDGEVGGRIVEVKTRKNWFKWGPPDYDIIQLQVYIRMHSRGEEGLLEEVNQDDPLFRRSTVVTCSDDQWRIIDEQLREAAREIRGASLETVRMWAQTLAQSE
jgi:hypothetical protein